MGTQSKGRLHLGNKIHWARNVVLRVRGFFPLSIIGCLLLALSVAAAWFEGIKQQDFVYLAIGFIVGLVILLMLVTILAAAPFISRLCRRGSTRSGLALECGAVQETGFSLPLPRWLPLFEYSWVWNHPENVEVRGDAHTDRRREFITPRRRGIHAEIRRRILFRDVLGLTSLEWELRESVETRFLPAKGPLDRMTLLDGLTGGDELSDPRGSFEGDRVDMRQYTPGDSPRLILWKIYARSRKLLVRIPERAMATRPRFCAYFVSGDGDEPGAGFMRVVLERGFLGENWLFGADNSPDYTGMLDEALSFLLRSAGADPKAATGLPAFVEHAQRNGFSACLVVLPPKPGAWVPAAASLLQNAGLRIHAFTVVDGPVESCLPGADWRKWLYVHKTGAPDRAPDLAWMARSFTSCRSPIFVMNRTAGTVSGDVRDLAPRRKAAQGQGGRA
jgi:hypothetical protein